MRRPQRGVLLQLSGAFSITLFEALAVMMDVLSLELETRRRATGYWLGKGEPERVRSILRGAQEDGNIKCDMGGVEQGKAKLWEK